MWIGRTAFVVFPNIFSILMKEFHLCSTANFIFNSFSKFETILDDTDYHFKGKINFQYYNSLFSKVSFVLVI